MRSASSGESIRSTRAQEPRARPSREVPLDRLLSNQCKVLSGNARQRGHDAVDIRHFFHQLLVLIEG
jgi:hypothetical protein